MATPQILDFAALLTPIPGDNPAGMFLMYGETYDAIKEARRADDSLERGEWQRDIKASEWPAVIELATDALSTKTKDLQITAWLVEALVYQHRFPGLRDGLRLVRELQEQFWEVLYPEREDGDLEARVLVLEFLDRALPLSVRQVPLTQGERYSWLYWKDSREVDNRSRQNPQAQVEALAEGKITGEQFDKAVTATSRSFYEMMFSDLNQCWEEYQQLDHVVEEKFGRDAPSLLELKKAIEECRMLIEGIVKKKRELEPDPTPAGAEEGETGAEPSTNHLDGEVVSLSAGTLRGAAVSFRPGSVAQEPQDRADALRQLAAVADYFRKAEPHSPVAYLVERAVRWGRMPLDQWLQTVIRDESVLAHVQETLGLKDSEGNN